MMTQDSYTILVSLGPVLTLLRHIVVSWALPLCCGRFLVDCVKRHGEGYCADFGKIHTEVVVKEFVQLSLPPVV
jgi:hypothetical protein